MNVLNLFRLDGKVAIVTGGAGMFGGQICEALGQAGAKVVVASRDIDRCEEQAESLRLNGCQAVAIALNLADESSIHEFVEQTLDRMGCIDILVNNAVSRDGLNNIEQTTAEGWQQAEQVNGLGTMLLSKAVVQTMRERQTGNIINISSIQGINGPHFPVYGDSGMTSGIEYTYTKWGMIGMTRWLANYYGKYNVRVNCISPGGYSPSWIEPNAGSEVFRRNYIERTPLGRFADDDDIKGAVVYLASSASKYVTGHNLVVDGGWSSW
ncbi:SDR family NAD(P)-dependent oxidoreductase [Paenibacillus eucommiae]|uniref:NAD(P)-dependent dehydrogenase (Short-subunit alcohol dehydrogenase family) n=1 Tax=Paenibacillus eucommiae TaxID=1355755 RepID=A0ABS4J8U9_9BACL|nr:SDR family oxidoreductase [Paenibacillus eucommiae]MBP1996282.1 NAD(P)-dependent dehydrogenase (short-subunit alcohol dehydrogenase family) [Paenibacillus eucommiae]